MAVCTNVTTATQSGCKATCGYCHATTTPAVYRDCLDIYRADPHTPSGRYQVTVTSSYGSTKSLSVWCDMSNGGGWTVFQKRFDGSVDFYQGIKSYEQGFGSIDEEFWLGLQNMYEMTAGHQNSLRVDIVDYAGNHSYEQYGGFSVGQGSDYRLHVNSNPSGTTNGHLEYYNNMAFSAKDMDRDTFTSGSCAERFHGAFWYNACLQKSNMNGLYKPGLDTQCLYYAMNYNDCNGNTAVEMKFRRED